MYLHPPPSMDEVPLRSPPGGIWDSKQGSWTMPAEAPYAHTRRPWTLSHPKDPCGFMAFNTRRPWTLSHPKDTCGFMAFNTPHYVGPFAPLYTATWGLRDLQEIKAELKDRYGVDDAWPVVCPVAPYVSFPKSKGPNYRPE